MARQCWRAIPDHFPLVELDEFVIMPNHVHGILWIAGVGANNHSPLHSPLPPSRSPQHPRGTSKTIGSVVRGFKIGVTKWMRENHFDGSVWQRNYYEHVIRDDESLNLIRQYILDNPARWMNDHDNPAVGANNHSPLQDNHSPLQSDGNRKEPR